jgi:DNA-directed RNA polymerase subunit F
MCVKKPVEMPIAAVTVKAEQNRVPLTHVARPPSIEPIRIVSAQEHAASQAAREAAKPAHHAAPTTEEDIREFLAKSGKTWTAEDVDRYLDLVNKGFLSIEHAD